MEPYQDPLVEQEDNYQSAANDYFMDGDFNITKHSLVISRFQVIEHNSNFQNLWAKGGIIKEINFELNFENFLEFPFIIRYSF